jgi:biopolymer transport protein ExbD
MALKRRNRAQVEFSMASMTDLIFLLLIFFMITASFVSPNALSLVLPKASQKIVTQKNVNISIDKDLNYYINNNKTSLELLPSAVQAELSKQTEAVLMISADKTVPVEHVVKVMVIGKKLNAKVILATQPE